MSVTEDRLPFADEPTPEAPLADPPLPPVQVIRSRRRRKTVEARLVDGVVRLMVPASMSAAEVDDHAV